MEQLDAVVIGAGVVGLAVARALALAGREVLVLEAASAIGTGVSSRSSEVIHAGLYYPGGSLKARLCVQGREWLYTYCRQRGIAHQRLGKLVVAGRGDQLPALRALQARGLANGVANLVWLDAHQARALEPALACVAALHSPDTGIVDSHALMLSLQGDLEHAGGMVALNAPLRQARCGAAGITLQAADGTWLRARSVVNAAGLAACTLAGQFLGLAERHVPTPFFAKGSYFALSGRAPFARLVYPLPEAGGLGVHYTLDLGGQARFGPDVQWVALADDLVVDAARSAPFYAQIRAYWPALPDGALVAAYAGVRPKITAPNQPAADFCIQGPAVHGVAGLVNLFGIESPGLTSALAIGQEVAQLLGN